MWILWGRKCEYWFSASLMLQNSWNHESKTGVFKIFEALVIWKIQYSHFLLTVFSHYLRFFRLNNQFCLIVHIMKIQSALLIINCKSREIALFCCAGLIKWMLNETNKTWYYMRIEWDLGRITPTVVERASLWPKLGFSFKSWGH